MSRRTGRNYELPRRRRVAVEPRTVPHPRLVDHAETISAVPMPTLSDYDELSSATTQEPLTLAELSGLFQHPRRTD